ncbi:MAG: hypothetical protein ACRD6B_20045 [Bryobacteraceae bacterium]
MATVASAQEPYPAGPLPPPSQQQAEPNPPAYPQPSQPIPAQLTLASGTYLAVRVDRTLSSDKNQPGDLFTATLEAPLVANGVVVAEPGEMLGGRVVVAEKHDAHRPGRLSIELNSLSLVDGQQVPIQSQLVSRRGGTTPGSVEAGRVATTAGLGAIIGAMAGRGTGAAIGAAIGGTAGLAGVLVTRHHDSVIPAEQPLTFRLTGPATISTASAPQAFHYVEPGEYNQAPPPSLGAPPAPYANTAPLPPRPPVYYPYASPYPYAYPYPYWGPGVSVYWGGYWPYRHYRAFGHRWH